MACRSMGNEVIRDKDDIANGIVNKCSCGWVSRPCFSGMVASSEWVDHREKTSINQQTDLRNTK